MKNMFVYMLGAAVLAVGTSCVTQQGGQAPVDAAAVEATAVEAKAEAKAEVKAEKAKKVEKAEKKAPAADAPVRASRSQAINEISYDADSRNLTIVFDRGTYVYADVPAEVYEGLVASDSQGAYYRNEIRGKYKGSRANQ
ncbi:MAG TPA: KTSC domain-containing protein [Kiritimatiellia bacterium]|nr:KTSC domain-containing protein [Kiritimatiellia bacterium]